MPVRQPDRPDRPDRPVRIGIIDFLNTWPIEYYLDNHLPGMACLRGVPTTVNRMLLDGQVAVAPISSYEFAWHTDTLLLVPGLSIAALGSVNSVLLFSWHNDLRELDGAPVALTSQSTSSIKLLHLLCKQRYHIAPRWVWLSQEIPLDRMLAENEAALLIGNQALIEGVRRREIGGRGVPFCFDLGDEWLKMTGLPFTFAVWGVRRDSVDAVREQGIVPALTASKADGLAALETIASEYAPRLGLPIDVCVRYLQRLRYHLNAEDRQGLRVFLEAALPGFAWEQIQEME